MSQSESQCLSFSSYEQLQDEAAVQGKLVSLGLGKAWASFLEGSLPYLGTGGFPKDGLFRYFCHLHGVPILIDNTILLARIPLEGRDLARCKDVERAVRCTSLISNWQNAFAELSLYRLDPEGSLDYQNGAVLWTSVCRFFSVSGYECQSLSSSGLTAAVVRMQTASNVTHSGLDATDQVLELSSLVANGIISDEEALKRLMVKRPPH